MYVGEIFKYLQFFEVSLKTTLNKAMQIHHNPLGMKQIFQIQGRSQIFQNEGGDKGVEGGWSGLKMEALHYRTLYKVSSYGGDVGGSRADVGSFPPP